MDFTIYTATGCARCKMVKQAMQLRGFTYTEYDMKADGKEAFQKFYAANRRAIFRGPEGIEFPIITYGKVIRQGLGASVAYLFGGAELDGFFSVGILHKEWVDGIHVSGGNPALADKMLEVLRYLKNEHHMKLHIDTNGLNSAILEQILTEDLADMMIMYVLGPPTLYSQLARQAVEMEEIKKSMQLITKFPQYQFITTVAPVVRGDDTISYLTKEEVAEAAQLIAQATDSMKEPYLIKLFIPKQSADDRFKALAPLSGPDLLPYRTAVRRHQVYVKIEKD